MIKENKTYKIKSEDKAAFVNRLEKLGVKVNSYNIKDDKLNNSFSIEFKDPKAIEIINGILKDSPKIDKINEVNKKDIIKLDVPLLIRLLEYSRENIKDDAVLHKLVENIINLSVNNEVLSMKNYNKIIDKITIEYFDPTLFEWEVEKDLEK
jgi:hypothetical protein